MFFLAIQICALAAEFPIYTPTTIEKYINTLSPPYSIFAYTTPNDNDNLQFSFLLFRLMLADMRLDTHKNSSHVVVIDKSQKKHEMTIYQNGHKPMKYKIMSYEDMVSHYGGFQFGGSLHINVIDEYQNKVSNILTGLQRNPRDLVSIENSKTITKRTYNRFKTLFSTRKTQRILIAEYILTHGTEYQKEKFSSILKWYNKTMGK